MKKKIILQLTDFAIHARDFRPAKTLEAATQQKNQSGEPRGRFYMNHSIKVNPDGTFQIVMQLPEELQKQIDNGEVEVEIAMPKGGVPIFAANDALEKIAQLKKKTRLKLASTGKTWKKV